MSSEQLTMNNVKHVHQGSRSKDYKQPLFFIVHFSLLIILFSLLLSCEQPSKTTAPETNNKAVEVTPQDAVVIKSFENLSQRLDAGLRIALLPVSGDQSIAREIYDNITVEFTNILVYDMVEREQLNQIIKEQKLQFSGLVDDKTAVEVGKLLGAQVIIIGDLPAGASRRLVFRALDVQTGKILAMSSERF